MKYVSISVDDLRRLIEKAGGKFEGNLYSESVTMVASMESAGQVSSILYGIMIVVSNFVFRSKNSLFFIDITQLPFTQSYY